MNWSPDQIAGWLKRAHPEDGSYQVSHETIYRSLFVQARGVLKKELLQHLRSKRTIRRSKQATQKGGDHGKIKDFISISERPTSVEDRAVPGHWEGDLLSGPKNSHIATLVERQASPSVASEGPWPVLIVDPHAGALLSTICKSTAGGQLYRHCAQAPMTVVTVIAARATPRPSIGWPGWPWSKPHGFGSGINRIVH